MSQLLDQLLHAARYRESARRAQTDPACQQQAKPHLFRMFGVWQCQDGRRRSSGATAEDAQMNMSRGITFFTQPGHFNCPGKYVP